MIESSSVRANVDLIQIDGKKIYLVGTAHISQASADLVQEIINEVRPDSVAVELCDSRFSSMKDPERWKNTDIVSVVRDGKVYVLLAQLILAAFQKKLGNQLHIKPGAEMMCAVAAAEQLNVPVVLADRDVRTTLKRTWANLSLWQSGRLLSTIIINTVGTRKIDAAEIERLKSADALEELLHEFSESLPSVRETLIDERDRYLAARIRSAPGQTVVAVVGAGHVPGIKRTIDTNIDLAALEIIPPRPLLGRLVGWSILLAFIAALVWGFFTSGVTGGMDMLIAWACITGFTAAVGAALALAHWMTVIAAFLSAPITTLHPLLASGWVAGLVEAMIRKPRVSDFETIADDLGSVRGIFRNRISHLLMVVVATNLLGSIGMALGVAAIASML